MKLRIERVASLPMEPNPETLYIIPDTAKGRLNLVATSMARTIQVPFVPPPPEQEYFPSLISAEYLNSLPFDEETGVIYIPDSTYVYDFRSGYFKDTVTGKLYNPETGHEIDPVTNLPIDPVTGELIYPEGYTPPAPEEYPEFVEKQISDPFFIANSVNQQEVDELLSTKVDVVAGKGLSSVNFTTELLNKLQAIESAATKNQTDAWLQNRANHTGTQHYMTITGLITALDGKVAVDGTKVLSTENLTAPEAQKLSLLSAQATKNQPDAWLLSRSNHTGVQPVSSVTGLESALASKVNKVPGKSLSTLNFSEALNSKLSGIAQGATKNATDADLRNRSTHTGEQPISSVSGLSEALSQKSTFISGKFVSDSSDLQRFINDKPNQQQIFDTWYRFSHNSSLQFPAIPSELNAWTFDTAANLVRNTTNSSSLIGAVSLDKYDNYRLRVKLASTNADDDWIGVVIAFVKDTDGREYTLICGRETTGFVGARWGLHYNFQQGAAGGAWDVANLNHTVKIANGNPPNGSLTPTVGWSARPDGTIVAVDRVGDVITVETSQFDNPTVLDPATRFTIDLGSDPRLAIFRGGSQYGFAGFSQAASSWNTLEFTNPQDAIFDISTGLSYIFSNGAWGTVGNLPHNWEPGTILNNPTNGKTFIVEQAGAAYTLLTPNKVVTKA